MALGWYCSAAAALLLAKCAAGQLSHVRPPVVGSPEYVQNRMRPVAMATPLPATDNSRSGSEYLAPPVPPNLTEHRSRALMAEAGYSKQNYFRLLQEAESGWTRRAAVTPSPAHKAAMAGAPKQMVFIGDSIVREIAQRYSALTDSPYTSLKWGCDKYEGIVCTEDNYTLPVKCNGVVFVSLSSFSRMNFWALFIRFHTRCKPAVTWIGDGLHYLLRGFTYVGTGVVGPGHTLLHSAGGRSIVTGRRRYFEALLRRAHAIGTNRGTRIVVSGMFTVDEHILMADPPKYDHARFHDFSVARAWAAVDAAVAESFRRVMRTSPVRAAMVADVPARYPGLRCDGMHYYSFVDSLYVTHNSWHDVGASTNGAVCAPSATLWDEWLVEFWRREMS
eukprot:TRINITY_DN18367_c0_g1_i1.p1 TRINITY_DN18367_c0_g1~~TRINITY_DN18367_c0_g1_i1.p1  ORF type:complete len:390 (+),score=13.50 TRINITY_DN18367_c0_g1_i1:58-1227(+)